MCLGRSSHSCATLCTYFLVQETPDFDKDLTRKGLQRRHLSEEQESVASQVGRRRRLSYLDELLVAGAASKAARACANPYGAKQPQSVDVMGSSFVLALDD